MSASDSAHPPHRRTGRRWRLMTALTHDPGEPFEAYRIFQEVPGPMGLALWQGVRDVTLWASVADRAGLFVRGAGARRLGLLEDARFPEELHAAVGVLTSLLAFPGEANPGALALACGRIARWAEARGSLATAFGYARAGAVALPNRAAHALEAGRIAGLRGDGPHAEVWLRRAVGLARREGDAASGAFAYAELGDWYASARRPGPARAAYVRALRLARRRGVYMARGRALYGLGQMERRAGRHAEAERLLRAAWRPLGHGHPLRERVSYALADLAVRQGRPQEAMDSLTALLGTTDRAPEQLRAQALLALCCARLELPARCAQHWNDAFALAGAVEPGEEQAAALLDLAHAALESKNAAQARTAALRARAAAERAGAAELAADASRLLDETRPAAPPGARGGS